jgi:hypothetical protein
LIRLLKSKEKDLRVGGLGVDQLAGISK